MSDFKCKSDNLYKVNFVLSERLKIKSVKMTALVYLLALVVVAEVRGAVVDLNCSDNAVCIQRMAKEFVRSMRQQKAVRVLDLLTIEPLPEQREGRSRQGLLAKFFNTHAFTFDWSDLSFRLSRPEHRSDSIALEVFQGRSLPTGNIFIKPLKNALVELRLDALKKGLSGNIFIKPLKNALVELRLDALKKGLSEEKEPETTEPKKSSSSSSKVKDDDEGEDKSSKGIRRRQKKKVLQALIPMMFGMKSAGTVIFAMAVVTALTIKAFIASKLALVVTVGMALKRLYESYYSGVGLQNHPYLYSQYPIDFPSASSHAYSVSGMNPQFATSDVYNPTALASHSHTHEMLQQSDATAQQSQPAPTVQLANATRATERWDGIPRRPMFYGTSRASSNSYSAYQQSRH